MALFAEFVLSAASPSQFPSDGLPEIGLVGRSNVGKSSLINALTGNKKLARTSNTPGRTQTLNFYRVWPEGKPKFGDPQLPEGTTDRFSLRGAAREAAQERGAFYFVDMPGYGFARVSESQRQAWRKLIEHYLLSREHLKGVIQVVDLRHPPSKDDLAMWDWLHHYGKKAICVATKADKVPRNQRSAHVRVIAQALGLRTIPEADPGSPDGPGRGPLLLFSAEDGLGREQLWPWVTATSAQL